MTWQPDLIDWLGLRSLLDYRGAIAEFLNSNPVLNGTLTRPTTHPNLAGLFEACSSETQRVLELALNNYRERTSRQIQEKMVNDVTKYLILQHYQFKRDFGRPRPARCSIAEGQVWFPASYYLIRKNTVFDWERGNPQRDFYQSFGVGSRHPTIVVSERRDGRYVLVPLTHSSGDLQIDFGNGRCRFAKHSFPCVASWNMLEGDGAARASGNWRITSADMARLKKKIDKEFI
jgi:hypothetical protein